MREIIGIFGVPIDNLNMEEAMNRFRELLKEDRMASIYTPNTEIIMLSEKDEYLKKALLDSQLNVPDGFGLVLAARLHGIGIKGKIAGIDLMEQILKYLNYTKKSVYVLGAKPDILAGALSKIKEDYPGIVVKDSHHGYFDKEKEQEIIRKINESKPDVLFVALGAPRQEKWIHEHKHQLNARVAMGVGGSLDVMSGVAKRAPKFMVDMGLEWLYRLIKEPWRFKRMLVIPKFLLKVLLTRDIIKE
ncbi:MAG: WecB/TagA/CpsF family glycosyltransferase [Peptostreptococcaceae bacterium]|nr:WecB/TagA/CpsF family glycosyltransferase [Peptostreptococcaceae bacterium]